MQLLVTTVIHNYIKHCNLLDSRDFLCYTISRCGSCIKKEQSQSASKANACPLGLEILMFIVLVILIGFLLLLKCLLSISIIYTCLHGCFYMTPRLPRVVFRLYIKLLGEICRYCNTYTRSLDKTWFLRLIAVCWAFIGKWVKRPGCIMSEVVQRYTCISESSNIVLDMRKTLWNLMASHTCMMASNELKYQSSCIIKPHVWYQVW